MWRDIEPTLRYLYDERVTDLEKVFGITTGIGKGITLRNWLSYTMRALIKRLEWIASYKPGIIPNILAFKNKFNAQIQYEIIINKYQHIHKGTLLKYDALITHHRTLCMDLNREHFKPVFKV